MMSIFRIIKFIISHPLATKNKRMALKRFIFFQIAKLFNPYPIVYSFTNKTKLIVERGMSGATGNIYCGLHEFEDMSFLLHFLRREDTFIDIGANIGSYTILASGHVGASSLSIEPVPSTFSRLQDNIMINRLEQKVRALNLGAGSKSEKLKFTKNLDTVNHVFFGASEEGVVEVKVESLDMIKQNMDPVLIKIDVEGYEYEVLKGATDTLSNEKLKAIIIEINGSGEKYGVTDEEVHKILMQYKFEPFAYDPYTRELKALDTFTDKNTIYIRDLAFVNMRVQEGPFFQSLGLII